MSERLVFNLKSPGQIVLQHRCYNDNNSGNIMSEYYVRVIAHNKTDLKKRGGKILYYGCSTRQNISPAPIEVGGGEKVTKI